MSPRIATVMGVVTVAVVGTWLNAKRRLRQAAPLPRQIEPEQTIATLHREPATIDDDEAADIIRRAQPALERARQFA